ncbi:MAG TPA: hypothetical protein VIW45_12460 [Vicinamibacterales bacterium]|jgi:hypothetical protein
MGFLLHAGATVLCAHGGTATPAVTNPRVKVGGQPTVTQAGTWTVAGCPLPTMSGGPCATAQWTTGATRVTSGGQPLLILGGASTCVPTGTPLNVVSTQARVSGT